MARAPLDQIEAFVAVARKGQMTAAATSMHLTVSALSHRMKRLEERLDTRLFARGPRGVALTPDGQRLFDAVTPHLDAVDLALQRFRRTDDDALTVTLLPSVASAWLLPRLPDFLGANPQVAINLQSTSALVDFERDNVDAGLRYGPGNWRGLLAEHLFDEWVTPVASPALLARIGRPKLGELGSAPLLGDPADRWTAWFERFGGTPPARFVAAFDDSETLQQAAVRGLGIALGRWTMLQPLLDSGLLVRLTPRRLRSEYGHYLVYPERSRGKRAFAGFRAWVLAQAADFRRAHGAMIDASRHRPVGRRRQGNP